MFDIKLNPWIRLILAIIGFILLMRLGKFPFVVNLIFAIVVYFVWDIIIWFF